MLEKATHGITFSKQVVQKMRDRLYDLASYNQGAHSVLNLFGILYDLSLLPSSTRVLPSQAFNSNTQSYHSRRVKRAYEFMFENYNQEIKLSDVANLVGMTEVAFSRFFKERTGRSFKLGIP